MFKKNLFALISGLALFVAMAKLPYGYYQLLRFFICGMGALASYLAYNENKKGWAWVFGIIALIFNPFVKIHFGKELWCMIDLVAGLIFCFYFAIQIKRRKAD